MSSITNIKIICLNVIILEPLFVPDAEEEHKFQKWHWEETLEQSLHPLCTSGKQFPFSHLPPTNTGENGFTSSAKMGKKLGIGNIR